MAVNISIVDDNNFLMNCIREKLSFFKELEFKWSANDGNEALDQLKLNSNLDLILMDIEMPKLNGIEATEIIKNRYPHIKIIMLTVFDNDKNIFDAIKAGADGYLLKDINADELYNGILDTIKGGAAMTPTIASRTLKLLRNPFTVEGSEKTESYNLTDREIQVLEQLSKGINYNLIAENLIISSGTVRKHIENIYKKLQVHNKIEAVTKAKRNNLI